MVTREAAEDGRDIVDMEWMSVALVEAKKAKASGEVPIGAVIVRDEQVVAKAHNLREQSQDPTAHAEILALREASHALGSWRLAGCTLYVTLEPCPMCAGALVQARLDRLVFGTRDPKAGCVGSLMNLVQFAYFNHQITVTEGVMREESVALLQQFFRQLRQKG